MQRQAGIYVRISSDPNGTRLGVTRQKTDCETRAKARGWTIAEVFEDNDVSASTGKRRPAYERMLDALRAGSINAVVVWDLDRLTRRPIEIEQFIELADQHGVELASVGGDIDLATETGRLIARIMGAAARHEVDHKSRRQRAANAQRREMGMPHAGSRGFGYAADGVTIRPDEAGAIRWAAGELLSGRSMMNVAAELNSRGQLTADGARWTGGNLRRTLLRPRLAGLMAFRGHLTGDVGTWPAILDQDTYSALTAVLGDPARRRPGRPRAYLLSGVGTCGKCGGKLAGSWEKQKGYAVLTCRASRGHMVRRMAEVEDYVVSLVIARLSRPDAVDRFARPDRTDEARELQQEEQSIRDRLNGLAEAFAAGDIDRAQMTVGTRRLNARLKEIGADLAAVLQAPDLTQLLTGDDTADAWDGMPLDRRRTVLVALFAAIIVHPPGRGARRFDPATVQISWK